MLADTLTQVKTHEDAAAGVSPPNVSRITCARCGSKHTTAACRRVRLMRLLGAPSTGLRLWNDEREHVGHNEDRPRPPARSRGGRTGLAVRADLRERTAHSRREDARRRARWWRPRQPCRRGRQAGAPRGPQVDEEAAAVVLHADDRGSIGLGAECSELRNVAFQKPGEELARPIEDGRWNLVCRVAGTLPSTAVAPNVVCMSCWLPALSAPVYASGHSARCACWMAVSRTQRRPGCADRSVSGSVTTGNLRLPAVERTES